MNFKCKLKSNLSDNCNLKVIYKVNSNKDFKDYMQAVLFKE